MANTWELLLQGFAVAFQVKYILYAVTGCFLGTVIGVLPGVGSAGALAMMLPIIFKLDPTGAVMMLAATYTGVMYGGSTASILLRVPGDTSAVVACLDGHEMARQGRAGPALCIAAIGSYIAGTIAVVGLMLLAPPLAELALQFTAPEYLMLYVFGLTAVASFASDSLIKALMSMCLGLMIATVGEDIMTGIRRYTFGHEALWDGIAFLAVTLGLFAVSEVLVNAKKLREDSLGKVLEHRIYIKLSEVKESIGAIFRGGTIGFLIGVLPGAGAGIASFVSYSIERQMHETPEKFGTGVIQGVAGPESANNAASAGSFVPMLALGVPGSATTAVMLGAFLILEIDAGPMLFQERPDIVWSLIAALYIGNVILLILNLPMIGVFVQILKLPMRLLLPLIIVISITGVYLSDGLVWSISFLLLFGCIGYYMRVYGFPLAPVILGRVLGLKMELSYRQSMVMTQGDIWLLLERPIVIIFLILSIVSLFLPQILARITGERKVVLDDDD
ncbi:MAG: tripartite tricarboxylate transporter TctA [Rhodospirillaceae bacterium]|nr:tripartite tricarboxylate transporter TctA [Rhodospirillaceae bacterium]